MKPSCLKLVYLQLPTAYCSFHTNLAPTLIYLMKGQDYNNNKRIQKLKRGKLSVVFKKCVSHSNDYIYIELIEMNN